MSTKKNDDLPLTWKVDTGNLIKEIIDGNPSSWVLLQPINIFRRKLILIAQRVGEIEDPILLDLMCDLSMYEFATQSSDKYDEAAVNEIKQKALELKKKLKTENE